MEFWKLYRIIRRRRWFILLGVVVCVGAVAFHNSQLQPLYNGHAEIQESRGMIDEVSLFPTFRQQMTQMDVQLRLSNLGRLVTSRRVIEGTANTLVDLGLVTDYESAMQDVIQNTSVSAVQDTNILAIDVTSEDPQLAKITADVITAKCKEYYGDLNNSSVRQSREFLEAQIEATREFMVEAQNALRDFKEEAGVFELGLQAQNYVNQLSQIRIQRASYIAQSQASAARAERLAKDLDDLPEWEKYSEVVSRNPVIDQLRQTLVSLESERASMIAGASGQPRRGPNHPEVLALDRQISDLRSQLENTSEHIFGQTAENRNDSWLFARREWVGAKANEYTNAANAQGLDPAISDLLNRLSYFPEYEAKLAELEANVNAATQTYSLMRNKLDEARIREQQAGNEIALKIIEPAYVTPVNQKQLIKLLLAIVLSPIIGVGITLLLNYTDNTTRTPQDAEKLLGLPVISVVPRTRAHSLPRQKCPEIIDISFQMLTSNLWIANQNDNVKSISIVSAEPDTGRSIIASNLAVSLAQEGARVILVDADLRQPTQHLLFNLSSNIGLTNLLSGGATIEDVLMPTTTSGLLIVPSGPVPDNPIKLLRSDEMQDFVEQVREAADFVIFDTPAGITFPDSVLVSSYVGNALVVHSAGRVPRGSEEEFSARLESLGVCLVGTVLNQVRREDSSGYFHYRRSYSGTPLKRLPGRKSTQVTST